VSFAALRSARPSDRLGELERFYRGALGCALLGKFVGHEGFDGLIVGEPGGAWQAEFVHDRQCPALPVPSDWHLLVFYVADRDALAERAAALDAAGAARVAPHNPYWVRHGLTYADPDGHRVVLAVPHGA
jgi:catechol 2,3-dioxygenase-like lactoylglutathione lyase family enzyme